MNIQEANKIIAEYMGFKVYSGRFGEDRIVTSIKNGRVNGNTVSSLYSKSLDSLVAVWEKMKLTDSYQQITNDGLWFFCVEGIDNELFGDSDLFGWEKTIQESACLATAKAIKEQQ